MPETQIISNAHGSFPQLEMFNVMRSPRHPRRHHTIAGHGMRYRERQAEAPSDEVNVETEIIKRLGNVCDQIAAPFTHRC